MRKGIRNPLYLGVPLAVSAILVTACSSSSSSTPSSSPVATATTGATSAASAASTSAPGDLGPQKAALEALYNQAVAAGQTSVVLYGPSTGSDQTLYKAFAADFPKIAVSGVPVVGPPMDAKLAAEFSSGKHIADIAYTGDTDLVAYQANGWLTKFTPITVSGPADLAPESVGPGDTFYGVTDAVAAIATNSNSSVPVPQTWADLESPDYKGKIAMYDPTAVGLAADNFAHLDLIPADKGLMAGLKANDVQLFPSSNITGPLTAVAQGAKSVAAGHELRLLPAGQGLGRARRVLTAEGGQLLGDPVRRDPQGGTGPAGRAAVRGLDVHAGRAEGDRRRGFVLDGHRGGRASGIARAVGDPLAATDPDIAGDRGGQ